jgi:mRNA interferase MazF
VVKRGEVRWAVSPQGIRRPYLVLTRQTVVNALHSVLAVPATRTVRGIPTEVRLGLDDGMPEACVLSLDNVTLMPKAFLGERITRLSARRMRAVCQALQIATGCSS